MENSKTLAAEALAVAKGFDQAAFEVALALHRLRELGTWDGAARNWAVFCSRRLGQPFEFCSALVDNARRVERATVQASFPLPDDDRLLWGLGAHEAALKRGEGLFSAPGPEVPMLSTSETLAEARRLRAALARVRYQAEMMVVLGREALNAGGIEAADGSPEAVQRAALAKFETLFGEQVGTMARASILREAILAGEGEAA